MAKKKQKNKKVVHSNVLKIEALSKGITQVTNSSKLANQFFRKRNAARMPCIVIKFDEAVVQ